MTIEEEIFRKTKIDYQKIVQYGFKKEKSLYKYSRKMMNSTLRADIEIHHDGVVKGKIYDLAFGDEYTNFRVEDSTGAFVGQVKEEFENLLKDIRSHCFTRENFIYEQSNRIAKAIQEKYGDEPEFEWEKFPGYAIFRNQESQKWYAIVMNLDRSKLKEKSTGEVEIINIKVEPNEVEALCKQNGFYPAYHMNKKSWITMTLDDTIADETIMNLVEKSYAYTRKQKNRAKNEWIVPANPQYFDIEKALEESHTMLWKQSADVQINDIVYVYVAAPYSCIMYQFKVVEINIPYEYQDQNLKMRKVMKMELLTRYPKGEFSFPILKKFGINAVRSQRYMPLAFSEYIQQRKTEMAIAEG